MFAKIKSYFISEWQVNDPLMWILFILFGIQFLPGFGAFDVVSFRWYALALVNFGGFIFLLLNIKKLHPIWCGAIWNNKVNVSYALFLIAGIISIIQAHNKIESLHVLTHLLITFLTFLNFALILQARLRLFDVVVKITHLFLFANLCTLFIGYFYLDFISQGLSGCMALSGGYGNKNIFAAAIVIKLPLVLYSMYMYKKFWKIFSGILLFGAIVGLFILTARATFLSSFIIALMVIVFCIALIIQKQRIKYHLAFIGSLLIILGSGFYTAKELLNYSIKLSKTGNSLAVTERIKSINASSASAQVRLFYWENAIQVAKQHFPYGCGLGNNKIESLKVENKKLTDFVISKHTHNDFLELFSEIGVGVVFYILIFVFAFWNFISVLRSRRSMRTRFVSLIAIAGLITYAIDALLNFPLERTSIQIYFAFFLALNLVMYLGLPTKRIMDKRKIKILLSIIIVITAATLSIAYLAYKSSKLQFQTYFDQQRNRYQYSYDKVKNDFPFIPSISEICVPISVMKSDYLIHEGKYEEAINLLLSDSSSNPYIVLREMKLKDAYMKKGDTLSAILYAQKAVDLRPNYYPNNKELARLYCGINAIDSAENVINEYMGSNPKNPQAWIDKANIIYDYAKNYKESISLLDTAIELMPKQKVLYAEKITLAKEFKALNDVIYFGKEYIDSFPKEALGYTEIGEYYQTQKNYKKAAAMYKQALECDSLHYKALLGLARISMVKNKYSEIVNFVRPCLTAKNKEIKAEAYYLQGYSSYHLRKKTEACESLKESMALGSKEAEKLSKQICKEK